MWPVFDIRILFLLELATYLPGIIKKIFLETKKKKIEFLFKVFFSFVFCFTTWSAGLLMSTTNLQYNKQPR